VFSSQAPLSLSPYGQGTQTLKTLEFTLQSGQGFSKPGSLPHGPDCAQLAFDGFQTDKDSVFKQPYFP
jgi:hypothetical protein